MINAMQQETGADINVDDNGIIGTVTVGARDGAAVKEAIRRIELILDPPKAEVGATYRGKVVNITKFGAFVNILPGPGRAPAHFQAVQAVPGKRVERVEDVLSLGDDLEVHVDDIDPVGKVSLSLKEAAGAKPAARRPRCQRAPARRRRAEVPPTRALRTRRSRSRTPGKKRLVRPSATSARPPARTPPPVPERHRPSVAERRRPGPGTAAQPSPAPLSGRRGQRPGREATKTRW